MHRERVAAAVMAAWTILWCAPEPASAAPGLSSRAAALGAFPDNPLLASVPADTPYVFATFKPVPPDVLRGIFGLASRLAHRGFLMTATNPAADDSAMLRDIAALDARRLEAFGFSAKARFVVYGLGEHPVLRLELSSGERAFQALHRGSPSLATDRNGWHTWWFDGSHGKRFIAIGAREIVVTAAPRDVVDRNLDVMLAVTPPAAGLTTAQMRDLANRDGFTGQGIGFIDVARAGALIARLLGGGTGCTTAITAFAQQVPRIVIGLEDVSTQRFAIGVVLELAAPALAEVRGLGGTLAGFDRFLSQRPLASVAVTANVERGRPLATRAAGAIEGLAHACQLSGLRDAMAQAATVLTRPLPPFLAGMRGFVVITDIKIGQPESIVGFGALQLDSTVEFLKASPRIDLKPDRKPRTMLGLFPAPGHIALSDTVIGVSLGAKAAPATAVALVNARAQSAPLAAIQLDYRRYSAIAQNSTLDRDTRRLVEGLGLMTMQLVADERGLVVWSSFDMR